MNPPKDKPYCHFCNISVEFSLKVYHPAFQAETSDNDFRQEEKNSTE
jgi:hypothetical protein